jgi:putative ABC transport system ATP-binding protein
VGSSAEILLATGVEKSYDTGAEIVPALAGIDLRVADGEFLAVTGASGSGKTTLLNCLSGLDRIDAGSVIVDGVDLTNASDALRTQQRASSMGFVFQAPNLLTVFTAEENVALPMIVTGTSKKKARVAARAVLARVGLEHRADHLPGQLSGGERTRVAIARAFVRRPRIVWADEPTGNLDSQSAGGVIDLLEELRRDGATLILVTHDAGLSARADRRVKMRDGRLTNGHTAEA